jgi:hypothetical protein
LASIGETGGMTGSFTGSLCRLGRERVCALAKPALCFGLACAQVLQALFEGRNLTEPPSVLGLDEALLGVLGHLVDTAELRRIHSQEPASRAGVLMHTRRAVRPMTLAERNAAQQEVLFEFGPLIGLGHAVFSNRTQLSSPLDERLVGGD